MTNIYERPHLDLGNSIEREINGCRVLLLFSLRRNESVERQVLDNLMLVFERKIQGLSSL